MPELTDERLALILRSVGDHLDVGAADDAGPTTRRSRSRTLLAVAAVAFALLALAVTVGPVRRSVAGWLSIGSTEIVMRIDDDAADVADVPALPELQDSSRTISEREASALVDTAAIGSSTLGPPERWAVPAEGGVLAVWSDGMTTLWVRSPDVGADVLVTKLVDAGEDAQRVDGLGTSALAVTGEHVLLTPSRAVSARTVVLWTDHVREHRLESDLPLEAMIDIARTIDVEGED